MGVQAKLTPKAIIARAGWDQGFAGFLFRKRNKPETEADGLNRFTKNTMRDRAI
jgi:hypothetical protein